MGGLLEMFSGTPARPQVLNCHPPFYPAYVLHSGLQGVGKQPNKWVCRSRIAIYMGTLPRHAWSVALVLSLSTGCMSPWFHMKFDNFFETAQDPKTRPKSMWQSLAHFVTPKRQDTTLTGSQVRIGKVKYESRSSGCEPRVSNF
jgi:hypothetical protein